MPAMTVFLYDLHVQLQYDGQTKDSEKSRLDDQLQSGHYSNAMSDVMRILCLQIIGILPF